MSEDTAHRKHVEEARFAVASEIEALQCIVELHLTRENTDYLGLLDMAVSDVQDVFDDAPDSGVLSLGEANAAYEAFFEIASLAIAQLANLRVLHPLVGVCEDDHSEEAEA